MRSEQWLSDLEALDETMLLFKLSENVWSLAEIYDHVIKVGRMCHLVNFNKSIVQPEFKCIKKLYAYLVFDLNILSKFKIKIDPFEQEYINLYRPDLKPKSDLLSDFTNFIQDVDLVMASLSDLKKQNKLNKHNHSFLGGINSLEWIALIEIHMSYHEYQRKQLLKIIKRHFN